MDVEDVISRLAGATDEELAGALAHLATQAAEAGEAPVTEEGVAALESLATATTQVLAEQGRRIELAERVSKARAAFANIPTAPVEEAPVEEAAAKEPADEDDEDDEGKPKGLSASGKAPLGSIGKQAPKGKPAPTGDVITVTTRATAGSATYAVGQQHDRWSLAAAMREKFQAIRNTSAFGQHHVARLEFSYPAERTLSATDEIHNLKAIERVTGPKALTAAGGFCAPAENLYDIESIGTIDRPIWNALARFGVDRGAIKFRGPMDPLALTSGLGVWSAADDALVGVVEDPDVADPAKTCFTVECPGTIDASVYSVYLCLKYPNWTARFDPEWVDASNSAALVAHARFAENELLTRLLAGSKIVQQASLVSGVRDILVALDKIQAYYRYRHRYSADTRFHWILPIWLRDLFRADLARGFAGDLEALAISDQVINTWFANRNINVTWHLDGRAGETVTGVVVPAQQYANMTAGATITGFPDKIDGVLYAEGEWLGLDGGTLDLGLVRDSTLNSQNRYQQFTESWEGVAFRGIESLRTVIGVQPSGAVVGTIPPVTTATPFTD